jgi:hypothetical protein
MLPRFYLFTGELKTKQNKINLKQNKDAVWKNYRPWIQGQFTPKRFANAHASSRWSIRRIKSSPTPTGKSDDSWTSFLAIHPAQQLTLQDVQGNTFFCMHFLMQSVSLKHNTLLCFDFLSQVTLALALLLAVAVARPQFAGNRPIRPIGGTFAFPQLGKFLCQPSLETFINL